MLDDLRHFDPEADQFQLIPPHIAAAALIGALLVGSFLEWYLR